MEALVWSSFGVLTFSALFMRRLASRPPEKEEQEDAKQKQDEVRNADEEAEIKLKEARFRKLQLTFFSAYFPAILGDWLQVILSDVLECFVHVSVKNQAFFSLVTSMDTCFGPVPHMDVPVRHHPDHCFTRQTTCFLLNQYNSNFKTNFVFEGVEFGVTF